MVRTRLLAKAALLFAVATFVSQSAAFAVTRTTTGTLSVGLIILDPYKSYHFEIVMDGHPVAGVDKLGGPDLKLPGSGLNFEAITLERGLTHDAAFEEWIKSGRAGARDIRIALVDAAGDTTTSYTVHRAWVSQYQAQPDLNAGASAVAIQHLKLENEGWNQDPSKD